MTTSAGLMAGLKCQTKSETASIHGKSIVSLVVGVSPPIFAMLANIIIKRTRETDAFILGQ